MIGCMGDNKTGEIAQFELGLKRTGCGAPRTASFVGSNWARDPAVIAKIPPSILKAPPLPPMRAASLGRFDGTPDKGKIDVHLAEKFMADHYDTFLKERPPMSALLCAHVEIRRAACAIWVGLRTTLAARLPAK